MKTRAMVFKGTVRELGEFLKRAREAEQYKGIISDSYFYGSASRSGYLKEGGYADFAAFEQQPAATDRDLLKIAG